MNKALIIFGSKTDEKIYNEIAKGLKKAKVDFDLRVSSAHKTPEDVDTTLQWDYSVIIAGAGLAAHLPGVVAARVIRPVIGVPCEGNYQGLDALLSIAQMPPGVPVAAMAIGKPGAKNAGLFALRIIALHDKGTAKKLARFKNEQRRKILDTKLTDKRD